MSPQEKDTGMARSTLFLAGLLLAVSAAAQDVKYNFDDQADFSKYRTYRWEKHPQSVESTKLQATSCARR